jgi:hypothetical protein
VSVPLWVGELASEFWAEAGEEEPFPRQLRRPILRALPLDVIELPGLCVAAVLDWLRQRNVVLALGEPDRPLRGCLVAGKGHGFAFFDRGDSPDEQRFSLAHELAHFLRDYLQPRRRAEARLGPQVRAVFDGERPAHPEERLHALFGAVKVGFHTHLMARDPDGNPDDSAAASEGEADRLAYELLAPAATVLARVGRARDRQRAAIRLLREVFGLPEAQARCYADLLFPPAPPADPLLRRLRIVRNLSNFDGGAGK